MIDKALNILFIAYDRNLSIGSYRIWVNDYCYYFNAIGIKSKIFSGNPEEIKNADVIILSKGSKQNLINDFGYIRSNYPDKIIGTITPPRDLTDVEFDFVMAGSMEEADSLSFHKNVIVNAHIEQLFYGYSRKIHTKKDVLKIVYHGWTAHLASFSPNLKTALEEFEKECDIELVIISETENAVWRRNSLPNIKNISYRKWNIKTIRENIMEGDIGIIPGIHDLTHLVQNGSEPTDPSSGLFHTDYVFRFKNKSNNGRSLAFFQLGIPVVGDFTPSHLHILGDGDCGFLAHSKDGWLRSFRILKDESKRNKISQRAYDKVNREYNPLLWAEKYYSQILEIYNNRSL
jgi:hypothetical protein